MRRAVTAISLALAFLLATPLASELAVSHYRRSQASKLLATVREFQPGITTEAQARVALKPFSRYEDIEDRNRDGMAIRGVEYQFYNGTSWTYSLAYHLRFLPFRFTLPWTLFAVSLQFVDGLLREIHINEMQEDIPGFIHPNGASVSLLSARFDQLPKSPYGRLPTDFNGFSEHSQSTSGLDEKGNLTGFTCCHERFIQLDERASPAQFSNSLNFHLYCMTSFLRCKDDRQILP